mmetsp:Transcript_80546/g.224098  ORF Transcript_80546/g.224098 Transcript_80546/m.224098 type:complete len:205 (-) Transcript_80546:1239-1853(-)
MPWRCVRSEGNLSRPCQKQSGIGQPEQGAGKLSRPCQRQSESGQFEQREGPSAPGQRRPSMRRLGHQPRGGWRLHRRLFGGTGEPTLCAGRGGFLWKRHLGGIDGPRPRTRRNQRLQKQRPGRSQRLQNRHLGAIERSGSCAGRNQCQQKQHFGGAERSQPRAGRGWHLQRWHRRSIDHASPRASRGQRLQSWHPGGAGDGVTF